MKSTLIRKATLAVSLSLSFAVLLLGACDLPGNGGPYTGDKASANAPISEDLLYLSCTANPAETLTDATVKLYKIPGVTPTTTTYQIIYTAAACANCQDQGKVNSLLDVTEDADLRFSGAQPSVVTINLERSASTDDFVGTLDDLTVDHAFHVNLTCKK